MLNNFKENNVQLFSFNEKCNAGVFSFQKEFNKKTKKKFYSQGNRYVEYFGSNW